MAVENNENVAWDANPEAGTRKTFEVKDVEFPFRYCPRGTFTMGSPENEDGRRDDEVLCEAALTRGLGPLETSVTQEMYEAITGENPSAYPPVGPDSPVEEVR